MPYSASDRYSDMVFKNSLNGVPMSQPNHVEFPKFARSYDEEGKLIAEQLVHSAREELAFLQSSNAQPKPTKAEEENQSLVAMIAKLQAELDAMKAQKVEAPVPVVATSPEMALTPLELAKRETKAKLAKLSTPEAE